jgi:hypothetical protein
MKQKKKNSGAKPTTQQSDEGRINTKAEEEKKIQEQRHWSFGSRERERERKERKGEREKKAREDTEILPLH